MRCRITRPMYSQLMSSAPPMLMTLIGQQQGEAGGDGLGGRLRGFLGGQRGGSDQLVHFDQQVSGLLPAEGQEGALLFGQLQFRPQGYENAVFVQPQLFQPGIQRREALLKF